MVRNIGLDDLDRKLRLAFAGTIHRVMNLDSHFWHILIVAWLLARLAFLCPAAAPAPSSPPTFPRLMGMNIGAKNYDDPEYQRQLARHAVVIFGFYKGWKPSYGMAKVVRNLKQLSGGKILVGQYTILSECQDNPKDAANLDVRTKLNEMNWWARKADGSRVQWTKPARPFVVVLVYANPFPEEEAAGELSDGPAVFADPRGPVRAIRSSRNKFPNVLS